MLKKGQTLSSELEEIIKIYRQQGTSFPILLNDIVIFPGFCDVHIHLREPGFFYKESVQSGTLAAVHGGYTTVCAMPNVVPVPDSIENLKVQLDIIDKDACIQVLPYGAITVGEKGEKLSDMECLAPFVCAFSDDGRGVQNDGVMLEAMAKAKKINKIIAAHCEDNRYVNGGVISDGKFARVHGIKGIPAESEYLQIERDLRLAKKTGVKYHICHISAKESVELIRKAKKEGIDVSCETAPHYLTLTDSDLKDEGRFKMNPPIRTKRDRDALIEGLIDGTIDMIATDHAPHSKEEKSKGLIDSAFGITGLETAFPILYAHLVRENIISMQKLAELLCYNPRKRFDIRAREDDYTVFELATPYKIDSSKFLSKGKSTPFENEKVYGDCLLTVCGGKIVWQKNMTEN